MNGIGDNLSGGRPASQRTDGGGAGAPGDGGLLARLGLHRPELRAWAMYDWAISGMQAVILASVFQIYFARVAAAGLEGSQATAAWSATNTAGAVLVAVIAPILGALADSGLVRAHHAGRG